MARADQRRVTVKVDDIDLGVADTKGGGAVDSEDTKHRPGGMQDERSYGGPVTVENVTATFVLDLDVLWAKVPKLRAKVGKGKATLTEQPLDVDGNAKGKPDVYSGVLKAVTPPDYDANATGDVGKLEIEVSVSGPVG